MKHSLNHCADAFDAPPDSERHITLLRDLWIAGLTVYVRYYLGRLIGKNLFRLSDADVSTELKSFLSDRTSAHGAAIAHRAGLQGWMAVAPLLRHLFEEGVVGQSSLDPKQVAAIESFLRDPNLADEDVAAAAGITMGQLQRIVELSILRKHIHAND